MTYTNGDIYNGRWSSNKMDGTGSFTKVNIWEIRPPPGNSPVSGNLTKAGEKKIEAQSWKRKSKGRGTRYKLQVPISPPLVQRKSEYLLYIYIFQKALLEKKVHN